MNVIVDRRMVRSRDEKLEMTCAECGNVAEEAVVQLGDFIDGEDWDWRSEPFCLPCLKRAVAEAEAAVARDKA